MMFRKKKPGPDSRDHNHGPRGRDSGKSASALAHRFLDDEEPDTIDLAGAPGFPAEDSVDEPDTQVTLAGESAPVRAERAALIRHDSDNGKFYLDPEAVGQTVYLAGEAVTTTTELRKGDCIRVGDVEFTFRAVKNTS